MHVAAWCKRDTVITIEAGNVAEQFLGVWATCSKKKNKTKRKVWEYFGFPADAIGAIIDNKKTVCKRCKVVIAYSGNTSNLMYHLQWMHRELLGKQEDSNNKSGQTRENAPKSKQLTLGGTIAWAAPHHHDSTKHKQLVEANAVYIVQIIIMLWKSNILVIFFEYLGTTPLKYCHDIWYIMT